MNEKPQTSSQHDPVNIPAIRHDIKQLIGREAKAMVNKILSENGHRCYLAMKYLFEISGIFPSGDAQPPEEDDSLTHRLLHRLGFADEFEVAQPGNKNPDQKPGGKKDDKKDEQNKVQPITKETGPPPSAPPMP